MKPITNPTTASTMNISKIETDLGKLHTDLTRRLMAGDDKIGEAEFEELEQAEELLDAIRTELSQMQEGPSDYFQNCENGSRSFPGKYVEALTRSFPRGVIAGLLDRLPPEHNARLHNKFGPLPSIG